MHLIKLMIGIGILVGGTIGGWIGALMTHGNWFSVASLALSCIGSVLGIFAAYKINKMYFE